jgi:nucleoside-diphosphate-sugar epimerase
MRVAVTGSSGKIGVEAVKTLTEHGHDVVGLDTRPGRGKEPTIDVDCTDFGAVMGALSGVDVAGGAFDSIIHLAGIPGPGRATDAETFSTNAVAAYNVLTAASRLGIRRVVQASSETLHGLPFETAPAFLPIDETHPVRPEWSYSLSKQVAETIADAVAAWNPEMSIVSLRFSNVMTLDDYQNSSHDPEEDAIRKGNAWGYVDARDAGRACLNGVQADVHGHRRLIIAAADTFSATPTADLLDSYFPEVPLTDPVPNHTSLLDSARARGEIGYILPTTVAAAT